MKKLFTFFLLILLTSSLYSQANFQKSLHYTREGKRDAYKKSNGGMELITNIPMDSLACVKCHSSTEKYPNGDTIIAKYYVPSCNDCHNFTTGNTVAEQTCLNCHSRQSYERTAYPDIDVHKAKGLTCTSCHKKGELHGDDGVMYSSLKQNGAIKVKCVDCHTQLSSNSSHNTHKNKVDCAVCHTVGVLTCAGCHFETVLATGKNRAINQIKNYKLLVKKDGIIRLGGFMSHSYNGKTNYIISSYHSHAIKKDATTCTDCHANYGGSIAAITEYNASGTMTVNKWNSTTRKVEGPTGIVPITSDWKKALKFDFVTYNGDKTNMTSDPTKWDYLKSSVDNAHLFYCEPLDDATLTKLGITRKPTAVNTTSELPKEYSLSQNYPNPFNPSTKISYSIPKDSKVKLVVYDALGRIVNTLVDEYKTAGSYDVKFEAGDLPSGIYYYKLTTINYSNTKKMLLLK